MKRVLIMGASSGIGFAVAEALASRGIMVGAAARHTASLEELKKKYPDTVDFASIDVTKPEAVAQTQQLIEKMGGMDIYFHVAGIGVENLTLDPEREVEIINTNAAGFARMLCTAYRYFRDNNRRGQIAAVTSVAGTNDIARLSAYSASKAFDQKYMVALEQLSHDEGAKIDFTDIRPGWVRTPLLPEGHKYPMEMSVEYVMQQVIKAIVRKRRVAVIDWRWNLIVGGWRTLPNRVWTRMNPDLCTPDEPMPGKLD